MNLKVGLVACSLLLAAGCDTFTGNTNFAERSETVSLTGTVEAIFPEDRLFKVRNGGTAVVFRAGPQVKNFAELEVGDTVTMDYYESVAVGMADPADPGTAIGEVLVGTAAEGDKPGAAMVGSGSTVVEFLSYDELTQTAEIKLADGTVERVGVAPEMRAFAAARTAGDRIAVAVDRALAVAVVPSE
ncbi:hypothetical protein [Aliiruegeria lutimaris]|uniref:Uncharacterized protein n=1 Tax=Aliiruegeria lutimaris TaxID=571298 RepID=A0A1G9BMU0_9RHOB|nr:hypothetical protein [Aliiruegeria lutimaris]SDK40570.1 hypothetical protein SAMN04488026_104017 [Aliiruegeria lutimaris]